MYRMGGRQLINKVLALLVIAAVAGVALGGLWLAPSGNVYADSHSATRSFSATSVDPGDMVTVTIVADNYGGLARIVETVPSGFMAADGSQEVRLRLLQQGPTTHMYTVTAKDDASGPQVFSGTIANETRDVRNVGGATTVRITAPATPQPSAVRSISPSSVEPGGTVTVTIRANNYGGLGRIVETLDSDLTSSDAVGQTVTLRLLQEGPQTVSYMVTAPDTTGEYGISGTLQDEDRNQHTVTGRDMVTVRDAAPPPPPPPPGPTDRRGMVSIDMGMPMVGDMLTATLTDADGGIAGTTWQWSRCEDAAGADCAGVANANSGSDTLTSSGYTPVEDDVGKYLKAMAMYRDANRSGLTASDVTDNAVEMANILSDYDADKQRDDREGGGRHGGAGLPLGPQRYHQG